MSRFVVHPLFAHQTAPAPAGPVEAATEAWPRPAAPRRPGVITVEPLAIEAPRRNQ